MGHEQDVRCSQVAARAVVNGPPRAISVLRLGVLLPTFHECFTGEILSCARQPRPLSSIPMSRCDGL